jgi:exopolysaccharide biosynthesis polyprenyl glycosylphosphotransferase
MVMKKFARTIALSYVLADFAGSSVAWGLFYLFRKHFIENQLYGEYFHMELGNKFYLGIILIPLFFLFVYAMAGFYSDPLRRSRLLELGKSLGMTLAAVVILFFMLILDDAVGHYSTYYLSFTVLFMLEFILTYVPRLVITSIVSGRIHRHEAGFRTLIVGSREKALKLISDIRGEKITAGNMLTGYLCARGNGGGPIGDDVRCLGTAEVIVRVIEENEIDEVILALEEDEYDLVEAIVDSICYRDVLVRAVLSMRGVISGHAEAGPIYATPLLRVSYREMPHWQYMIKTLLDYLLASMALVLLSPLMAVLAVLIRLSGKGPVIYRQERIGKNGRPFMIYKFRSMEERAEEGGPQLAVKGDTRITPLGRFMRKHRFDEIPNFINVLKGEMSLVGPRPERSHYIEQIRERAPWFNRVLAVRPGITCWGQVKLGYASDLERMLDRLDYDLLYLENVSLYLDMKIILYTLATIIRGKGI